MLSSDASSLLLVTGIVLVVYLVLRRKRSIRALPSCMITAVQANAIIDELKTWVATARQESQRLEAAVASARSHKVGKSEELLATFERLADPAALADSSALIKAAAVAGTLPPGVAPDTFLADQRPLAIARLADQGHTSQEISERLGLPLGDVEFLLNLREA